MYLQHLHSKSLSDVSRRRTAKDDRPMRNGQGFVVVYAINSRRSFDEIAYFREQILRTKETEKVPMVIVGNKCDLMNERQVTTTEGDTLAKRFGCPFMETSAKTDTNVQQIFYELVREIKKEMRLLQENNKPEHKKKNCNIL